jgi:hypothetical protein
MAQSSALKKFATSPPTSFDPRGIPKLLRFLRDLAREKWPSWGSENPRNPPIPPFGKGGRRGDFVKGGRGGIYRECAGKFLLTNPAKRGIGFTLAISAYWMNSQPFFTF